MAKELGTILTIGYGDQRWEDFVERLRRHAVEYIVDVRSKPSSRLPEYQQDSLKLLLRREGIKYVFMGHGLGGMPSDSTCYRDGRVDYNECESRPWFQDDLLRLERAAAQGCRVALLCSELEPSQCHRAKLVGPALVRKGIPVQHIRADGELESQGAVLSRLEGSIDALFDVARTSRGRYDPDTRRKAG